MSLFGIKFLSFFPFGNFTSIYLLLSAIFNNLRLDLQLLLPLKTILSDLLLFVFLYSWSFSLYFLSSYSYLLFPKYDPQFKGIHILFLPF